MTGSEEKPKKTEEVSLNQPNNDDTVDIVSTNESESDDEYAETPVVREITQTDRLNNHLLKAFLNEINSGYMNEMVKNSANEDQENNFDN